MLHKMDGILRKINIDNSTTNKSVSLTALVQNQSGAELFKIMKQFLLITTRMDVQQPRSANLA